MSVGISVNITLTQAGDIAVEPRVPLLVVGGELHQDTRCVGLRQPVNPTAASVNVGDAVPV